MNGNSSPSYLHYLAFLALALCIYCLSPAVYAQPAAFTPAVIYEAGAQKTDHAFTEAAQKGALQAKNELKINLLEYEWHSGEDREKLLEKAAKESSGHVIAIGFMNVVPVLKLAEKYPDVKFTVVDGIVPPLFPNVQSIIFKDHEGAFLVGLIAALQSRTGAIGFIGGMDVPLIRNFAYGYQQGARYARADIRVMTDMLGTTPEAWSNPAHAAQLAQQQYDNGVDVIFAAAGGSGLGVLSAAKQNNKFAIGVDTNQNQLYPGHVLTSMVKRVDKAVYETLKHAQEGSWEPGIKYLGVKDAMLDFSVDASNREILSSAIIDKAEAAKDLIVRGIIDVQVYSPQ